LRLAGEKSLKVHAVPPGNVIRVWYSAGNAPDVLLQVYTSSGRDVYREKRKVKPGRNDFTINIENLPPGIYILKIIEGAASESRSFVK
jgi:hypothetical protein